MGDGDKALNDLTSGEASLCVVTADNANQRLAIGEASCSGGMGVLDNKHEGLNHGIPDGGLITRSGIVGFTLNDGIPVVAHGAALGSLRDGSHQVSLPHGISGTVSNIDASFQVSGLNSKARYAVISKDPV
ncbi:hypothetical protein TorRG33x02_345360, partial [Trema orientale]